MMKTMWGSASTRVILSIGRLRPLRSERWPDRWLAPLLVVSAIGAVAVPAVRDVQAAGDPVKVGFIGSLTSGIGRSALRGAEIAIEELNAGGGVLGGRTVELVQADTRGDVLGGIEAYDYLNEVEEVDFIVSGSTDDVSYGWFPRMAEYRTPTLDTWASYAGLLDKVATEYEKYKMYFMNAACDYALVTLYVDFVKDVLAERMGWKSVVILYEGTPFGIGTRLFIAGIMETEAGIEVLDHVMYDVRTSDFASVYDQVVELAPDFVYLISSVDGQKPSSQYVDLQVPIPMTGINFAALGLDFWSDVDGAGEGISTLSPFPGAGMELDDISQAFAERYRERYGDSRPVFPLHNGFNAYHGVRNAFAAAERAGGFAPLDDWVREMESTDVRLYKDGELWHRYAYFGPGEVEPRTGREYVHNVKFDITAPYDDGAPSMVVVQWSADGVVEVVYPPKYASGEFSLPPWVQ